MIVFLLDEKSYKCSSSGLGIGSFTSINDLPKIADNYAKVVLFTDDTSIIVINSNKGGLQTTLNKTISDIISWLKVNCLLLNCNKTHYLELRTNNCIDTT